MKIKVVSRLDSFNHEDLDKIVISIGSIDAEYARYHKGENWKRVYEVYFDDLTPDCYGAFGCYTPMSEEQALALHNFIEDNLDTDYIIHCDAGISRSAAIASFMGKWYNAEIEYTVTGDDKYKNPWVYNLLNRLNYTSAFGEIE